jgi:hypothetical protein
MAQLPFPTTPDSCAIGAIAITPADSNLSAAVRALYVGGSGNVKITDALGNATTFNAVQAGSILPVTAVRVWSTGTTATSIVGLV